MLTIWGRISSINVRKVVLAAQLLEIPFERLDAGGAFGIVNTPAFLAKNPNAMVPLVEDQGFALWESNVIVRYLCAKHASGSLYPTELTARFDAERWMDWQQTSFNNAGREAFIQLIRTPPERRSAPAIAHSVALTTALLSQLDEKLGQRAFLAGEQLTMADIPMACEMHRWWGLPMEHAPYPNVQRWYQSITALPAARGVLDIPLS
ncbi:glutathione S-transferase family protein [uncultured Ramlibacter sp.]|uniref:glutathione S-transferase family protein n=1 Tax=uncultured Ramlibacter sp. TaxID=260755 RepID=UPI0026270E3E|nr:glutathione S-transferase [uncultured Ramlibacter sp.]